MSRSPRLPRLHSVRLASPPGARSSSLVGAVLALVLAAGCAEVPGTVYVPPDVPRTKDGLDLVTADAYFDREYLKPGADLQAYDAVLVEPLTLVYTEQYRRDHRFQRDDSVEHMIPDERLEQYRAQGRAQLRQMFRQALEHKLGQGGAYRLVEAPGPKVLSLTVQLIDLDLEPAIAEESEGRAGYYGVPPVVTVAAFVRDSATKAVLAETLNANSNPEAPVDADSFWGQIQDSFDDWAARFREMLDAGRATPGS